MSNAHDNLVSIQKSIVGNSNGQASDNLTTDVTNIGIATNMLSQLMDGTKNGTELTQIRNNQKRLIESDTYYISKYKAQSSVLQMIVFFCCLGLIGAVIYHNHWITSLVFTIYLGCLLAILLVFIIKDVIIIFFRDSRNFNEYDFGALYSPATSNSNSNSNLNTAELSQFPTCAL